MVLAILVVLMGLAVMFLAPSDLRKPKEKAENKLVSPAFFVMFWLEGFATILCAFCIKCTL